MSEPAQNSEWRSPLEINGVVEFQYPRSERRRVTDPCAERLRSLYLETIDGLADVSDEDLAHRRWVAVDACQEFGDMLAPDDTALGGFRWYAATILSAACAYETGRRRKAKAQREPNNG